VWRGSIVSAPLSPEGTEAGFLQHHQITNSVELSRFCPQIASPGEANGAKGHQCAFPQLPLCKPRPIVRFRQESPYP
jgi:hypothetical protein